MPESATAAPALPPGLPEQRTAGVGRRLFRAVWAPIRFARRSPRRAAMWLGLFLLITSACTAATGLVWFQYHLRQARQALEKGHNAVAIDHLRDCRLLYSDHREVLILSARAARRAGARDEADEILARYRELYGDEDAAVLERLLLKASGGDVDAVGLQLSARISAGGLEASLAREALVTGLISRFRWGEAAQVLQEWLADEPDSTTALLLQGKLEEQRQGYDAAIRLYTRIIELDPDQDEARLRLATQLLQARRGAEALSHVEVLRRSLPDHPEVAVHWVKALALAGRTEESRAALAICLKEHPAYAPALIESGSIKLLEGKEAEAEAEFARAVQLDPGNLVARNQYAFALARNGKAEEAARARAEADRLKADLEEITTLIVGPLQRNPKDPNTLHEIGMIALRSGLYKEAIDWFTRALQADPNHLATHRILVNVYRELNNPVLAARHRAFAQQLSERDLSTRH